MRSLLLQALFVLSALPALGEQTVPAPTPTPLDPRTLIAQAEAMFYDARLPARFDRTEGILKELELADPKEPYLWWARARLSFFRKENTLAAPPPGGQLEEKQLELADRCHRDADHCIKLAPKNPECHMMKGACYAMQASTWGVSLKSVQVLRPMDKEWDQAMHLPSRFKHLSEVTTRQLTAALRAILYRVMPESWWFRFFTGMRGDKEKAYQWMKEGIQGDLVREPMLILEHAVTNLCYAQAKNHPEIAVEGLELLKNGIALKPRNPEDQFDQAKMKILLEKPQEACNYRRERFENLSDEGVAQKLHSQP
jgi:hypothetical protein